MPHTTRKKRTSIPAQKRLQITDDEGWTRVTTGSNVRRALRTAHAAATPNSTHDEKPTLKPAEAPARLTFAELQAQYAVYREKWITSETWRALRVQLDERVRERARGTGGGGDGDGGTVTGPVDAIVCIGLGSPSGFLRGGWVDRRAVSMYQLAALESIKDRLLRVSPPPSFSFSFVVASLPFKDADPVPDRAANPDPNSNTNTSIQTQPLPLSFPIYAQDPVFNELDKTLLHSLGIIVLTHPTTFTLTTPNTLLFCPGAERKHLELVLPSTPCLVFGGPLEDTGSAVIQGYAAKTGSRVLVPFEACGDAFWKVRLYFWKGEEGEEDS